MNTKGLFIMMLAVFFAFAAYKYAPAVLSDDGLFVGLLKDLLPLR